MRSRVAKIVAAVAALTVALLPIAASAQSMSIATGVVVDIETAPDGALAAFTIVDGDGESRRFTVSASNPNTAYGLENRVGERWVSDHASEPVEAVSRLRDQQARLALISVQADASGMASSVVQAQSLEVATNLGYVFAVAIIAIIGIMGYVIYLGARQRAVAAEIRRLKGDEFDPDRGM